MQIVSLNFLVSFREPSLGLFLSRSRNDMGAGASRCRAADRPRMYFFGHLSMSMPNMRADTNP